MVSVVFLLAFVVVVFVVVVFVVVVFVFVVFVVVVFVVIVFVVVVFVVVVFVVVEISEESEVSKVTLCVKMSKVAFTDFLTKGSYRAARPAKT